MKLYYLMIVSILFSSCSTILITDEDGDGESNGNRFITKVYSDREKLDFHYFLRNLIPYTSDSDSDSESYWFVGGAPLHAPSAFLPPHEKKLTKNDTDYILKETSENKNFSVYEIVRGTDIGAFVVIAVEALPIFDEDPAILLISSTTFVTIAEALAYGVANEIPKLTITIPYLDLVFDPDTLVIKDHNMVEHLAAIIGDPNSDPVIPAKYKLLEIFGSKSFEEKQILLKTFNYEAILN